MFHLTLAYIFMIVIVAASNYLVLFPINDWLTWGAFPYPMSFLITELTNRFFGARTARRVVYVGFVVAAILSFWLSTPKIAAASLSAFLLAQLLDIFVFSHLRKVQWWYAPLVASFMASLCDATIFWTMAFWGEDLPVFTWAVGDTSVKLLMDIVLLMPFRWFLNRAKMPLEK